MPILTTKVTTPDPVKIINKVETGPDNYKDIVFNDNDIPHSSLISNISGAPWSVTYFKQVVTNHSELRPIDPNKDDVYQQYEKINHLEIRVQSALESSFDEDSGQSVVTGAALVYGFIIPNKHDLIIADAGDNKQILFNITSVQRKNFNYESVYAIEYSSLCYIDKTKELYKNIHSKVIREFYFSKDQLLEGKQPLLTVEKYHLIKSLNEHYFTLVNDYFKTFYNSRFSTLIIPGQQKSIYDPYIVRFVLSMVNTDQSIYIKKVKNLTTDHDPIMKQEQLWDLLSKRESIDQRRTVKKMGLVSKTQYESYVYSGGLKTSIINYVVYPIQVDEAILSQRDFDVKPALDFNLVDTERSIADILKDEIPHNGTTYKLTHPVIVDDYYVLSKSFYDGDSDMSILEILIKDYLKLHSIDNKLLNILCSDYKSWTRLDQFYYGPLLMLLLKETCSGVY